MNHNPRAQFEVAVSRNYLAALSGQKVHRQRDWCVRFIFRRWDEEMLEWTHVPAESRMYQAAARAVECAAVWS